MELRIRMDEVSHQLRLRGDESGLILEGEERTPVRFTIESSDATTLVLRLDERQLRARYVRRGRDLHLQIGARTAVFHLLDEEEEEELHRAQGSPIVRAPMPGKVLEILVAPGDTVTAGQPVIRVEAMKMEVDLAAAIDGVVVSVHAQAGQLVSPEDDLITLAGS